MAQTSISASHPLPLAGALGDASTYDAETLTNHEGSAVPFGVAVTKDTTDNVEKGFELPDAAAEPIIGVTMRSHAIVTDDLSGLGAVRDNAPVGCLTKGTMWVDVEENVSRYDTPWVRFATGAGGSQLGAFRKSSDSNTARRLKGGVYLSAGTAGGRALLHFDRTKELLPDVFALSYAEIAAVSATTTRFGLVVPSDKFFVLTSAQISNQAGLVADAANYFNVQVQTPAGAVLANWSTETGEEGTLSADTAHEMSLAAIGVRTLAPGSVLEFLFAETGTATLPANTVINLEGYYL